LTIVKSEGLIMSAKDLLIVVPYSDLGNLAPRCSLYAKPRIFAAHRRGSDPYDRWFAGVRQPSTLRM
jgi:hypothetical protein